MKNNIILLIGVLFLVACNTSTDENEIIYALPTLTTQQAQRVSTHSALLNVLVEEAILDVGEVAYGVRKDYTQLGFIWGTNEDLSFEDELIVMEPVIGSAQGELTGLMPETTYYYQSFAVNANDFVELGNIVAFTTHGAPPCDAIQENGFSPIFPSYTPMQVDNVTMEEPSIFTDGNISFVASSSNSIVKVIIYLNEIDMQLPLSGTYRGVLDFDNQSLKSSNEVKIKIEDFNGLLDFYPQGASMEEGRDIYIENVDGALKFVFCNVEIGEYVLNGSFSYRM